MQKCLFRNITASYPPAFTDTLQNQDERLGYQFKDDGNHPEGWYVPGSKTKYDFHKNPDTAKGLVLETKDTFDNRSTIEYDEYDLLPVKARQWIFEAVEVEDEDVYLETIAEYDYRILQAKMITDPNGNRSVFAFSPLGLMTKSGVIGKEGAVEGDIIDEQSQQWKPSVEMEYDFMAFKNHGQPVWVKTIQREQHYTDETNSPEIIKVEYTDGFGRLLQTRIQAEDVIFGKTKTDRQFGNSNLPQKQEDPNEDAIGVERGPSDKMNVVVSGWQVYDNKGQVIKQYEPYFDKGFTFEAAKNEHKFRKLRMYYDPRGQVVRTKNPDGSEQRVIFGIPDDLTKLPTTTYLLQNKITPTPWESYTYDANDLAKETHGENHNVPDDHHYTPSSVVMDALGRTIKTTEHQAHIKPNEEKEDVVMKYEYDIRGNLLKVTDALGRVAFHHKYDLKPVTGEGEEEQGANVLWTKHIDSGEKTAIFDAAFKPIEMQDERGAKVLNAYDQLSRLIKLWAKDNASAGFTLREKLIYGDDTENGPANPMATNHLGQLYPPSLASRECECFAASCSI
ncbi:MAG: hypothetical protein EA412_01955, partial [Chitinophagaceae bacterium]